MLPYAFSLVLVGMRQHQPGLFGEQITPPACDLPQLGHRGLDVQRFPAGVAGCRAGDPGARDPVRVRLAAGDAMVGPYRLSNVCSSQETRTPAVRGWPVRALVPSARREYGHNRPAHLSTALQGGHAMLRRLLTVGLMTAGLLTIGAPAFAAPPVTTTTHTKNFVETFVDIVPTSNCSEEGPLYTITTTTNSVEHTTIFDDGREHDSFTQTGTFVAVPLEDPSLPSYTGKITIWGGFNANGATVNGTFTFNLHATGSDGSTINTHQVDHFNVRPDGTVNEFFHCH
jgi:hypothetical protein